MAKCPFPLKDEARLLIGVDQLLIEAEALDLVEVEPQLRMPAGSSLPEPSLPCGLSQITAPEPPRVWIRSEELLE